MANYSCKKFLPTPYPLARVHPLQMDGETHDNHANSSTVTKVRSARKKSFKLATEKAIK